MSVIEKVGEFLNTLTMQYELWYKWWINAVVMILSVPHCLCWLLYFQNIITFLFEKWSCAVEILIWSDAVDFLTTLLGMPYSVVTEQQACSTEMVNRTLKQPLSVRFKKHLNVDKPTAVGEHCLVTAPQCQVQETHECGQTHGSGWTLPGHSPSVSGSRNTWMWTNPWQWVNAAWSQPLSVRFKKHMNVDKPMAVGERCLVTAPQCQVQETHECGQTHGSGLTLLGHSSSVSGSRNTWMWTNPWQWVNTAWSQDNRCPWV